MITKIITVILSSLAITIGIGILLMTIFVYKPINFISLGILIGSGTFILMIGLLPLGKENERVKH